MEAGFAGYILSQVLKYQDSSNQKIRTGRINVFREIRRDITIYYNIVVRCHNNITLENIMCAMREILYPSYIIPSCLRLLSVVTRNLPTYLIILRIKSYVRDEL